MAAQGVKISELSEDTVINGNEQILISDEGGSKRVSISQIINATGVHNQEHENEQNTYISALKQQIAKLQEKLSQVTTETTTQKTDESGNALYYQEDGSISTTVTNNPVYINNISGDSVDTDVWENYTV